MSEHANRSRRWLRQPHDHENGRGLSRPIWTEKTEDLARQQPKIQVVNGHLRAVPLCKPVRLNDRDRIGALRDEPALRRIARIFVNCRHGAQPSNVDVATFVWIAPWNQRRLMRPTIPA